MRRASVRFRASRGEDIQASLTPHLRRESRMSFASRRMLTVVRMSEFVTPRWGFRGRDAESSTQGCARGLMNLAPSVLPEGMPPAPARTSAFLTSRGHERTTREKNLHVSPEPGAGSPKPELQFQGNARGNAGPPNWLTRQASRGVRSQTGPPSLAERDAKMASVM